jgi:uncharacterized membrane protein (UPF0127 family)
MGFGRRKNLPAGMRHWAFGLVLAALALSAPPATGEEVCAEGRVDIRGLWGSARFTVELADDPAERAQGLMYRTQLATSRGMLFVYPEPGEPKFWMKNTLIPLDMLFLTPEGRVQHVRENAIPGDLRPAGGGPGVIAVLEIRGGVARMMGIAPGDELRHPAFDPAIAAWPGPVAD